MKMKVKSLVVSILSTVLILTSVTTAFGSTQSQAISAHVKDQANQKEQHLNIVRKLDRYVTRINDGTFRLNAPTSVTKNFDTKTLTAILSGMEKVNNLIRQGDLNSTSSKMVYDPSVDGYSIQGNLNEIVWHWWGANIYLNNTNTNILLGVIAKGAAADTIAAAIAGMVPGGQIASGILWIIDGVIGYIGADVLIAAAAGNGVEITGNYVGYFWISSQ